MDPLDYRRKKVLKYTSLIQSNLDISSGAGLDELLRNFETGLKARINRVKTTICETVSPFMDSAATQHRYSSWIS
jgi:hypothetical protein